MMRAPPPGPPQRGTSSASRSSPVISDRFFSRRSMMATSIPKTGRPITKNPQKVCRPTASLYISRAFAAAVSTAPRK